MEVEDDAIRRFDLRFNPMGPIGRIKRCAVLLELLVELALCRGSS